MIGTVAEHAIEHARAREDDPASKSVTVAEDTVEDVAVAAAEDTVEDAREDHLASWDIRVTG